MGAVEGEEEQRTRPQPLPLASYSPSVLPAGLPVELGPQLGLWDELGKGREEGVKFPPTSFSSSHVPRPPLSWWHNGHSDGKELEPAPGTSGNTS